MESEDDTLGTVGSRFPCACCRIAGPGRSRCCEYGRVHCQLFENVVPHVTPAVESRHRPWSRTPTEIFVSNYRQHGVSGRIRSQNYSNGSGDTESQYSRNKRQCDSLSCQLVSPPRRPLSSPLFDPPDAAIKSAMQTRRRTHSNAAPMNGSSEAVVAMEKMVPSMEYENARNEWTSRVPRIEAWRPPGGRDPNIRVSHPEDLRS